MSTVAASTLRTATLALDGTPTAVAPPTGMNQVLEIRAIGTVAWTYRHAAGDPGFPVAADLEVVIPVANAAEVLFAGTGTLSVAFFGNG